eukprot:TRINITY_DN4577_c0_g1_i1.p1 TRINITY_DN4577_c0_g1~~TRINITY_DN4577_c0_g1_i1.p1  ORF type:complete len:227 (+),score=25.41 TRINITY_DN4577_c0_g1_i1:22-681(+)
MTTISNASSLPHDIWVEIAFHLPISDICNFALVSQAHNAAVADELLWQRHCEQHSLTQRVLDSHTWKYTYKESMGGPVGQYFYSKTYPTYNWLWTWTPGQSLPQLRSMPLDYSMITTIVRARHLHPAVMFHIHFKLPAIAYDYLVVDLGFLSASPYASVPVSRRPYTARSASNAADTVMAQSHSEQSEVEVWLATIESARKELQAVFEQAFMLLASNAH